MLHRPPCNVNASRIMSSRSPALRPLPCPSQQGRLTCRHGTLLKPLLSSASQLSTVPAAQRLCKPPSLTASQPSLPSSNESPPICSPTRSTALCAGHPRSCRISDSPPSRAAACGLRGEWRVTLAEVVPEQDTLVAVPGSREEALVLLEQLQRDAAEWGTPEGLNLVAFGGGVASMLTAFLVHSVFEGNNAVVFGCSRSSSSAAQSERVQQLAECLGVDFLELPTDGVDLSVVSSTPGSRREAAQHPELAAALAALAPRLAAPEYEGLPVVVFDGRHAEDLRGMGWEEEQAVPSWEGSDDQGSDHFRSLAAMDLDCWDLPPPPATLHWPQAGAAGAPALRVSLLARLPETAVRAVAQAAGLPNWDWIAPGGETEDMCVEKALERAPAVATARSLEVAGAKLDAPKMDADAG